MPPHVDLGHCCCTDSVMKQKTFCSAFRTLAQQRGSIYNWIRSSGRYLQSENYHQYLYDYMFVALSDRKPLMYIFNHSRATPVMASAKIQKWAILLGSYHYTVKFKPGHVMQLPMYSADFPWLSGWRKY